MSFFKYFFKVCFVINEQCHILSIVSVLMNYYICFFVPRVLLSNLLNDLLYDIQSEMLSELKLIHVHIPILLVLPLVLIVITSVVRMQLSLLFKFI